MQKHKNAPSAWSGWIFRVIKGAVVGVGAILPGISGGVLCVVLGIYQPMMEFLDHPFKSLKKQIPFFLPIVIGVGIGFVGLARLVEWLFEFAEVHAIWLFIGLILGTLPALFKQAGEQGRPTAAWIAFGISFAVMMAVLLLLGGGAGMQVTPNFLWWLLCGALWGIGFIVPGMSPSSFFIFMGLYQPMTQGIASLDFALLIPLGLGLVGSVFALTKAINFLLRRYYAIMFQAILGIVLASTLAIVPLGGSPTALDIGLYALCFIAGAAAALGMDWVNNNMQKRGLK